jgi:protein-S-isoprenylcysteine O-methyltransferase Ste14
MIYLILSIIYIFTLHFVGDFVLQTREMANNKSKSVKWLSIHVLRYFQTLVAGAILFSLIVYFVWDSVVEPSALIYFCISNALLHWFTDYLTSKQTSRLWVKEDVKGFFTMIGFDQLLHASCLLLTLYTFFLS